MARNPAPSINPRDPVLAPLKGFLDWVRRTLEIDFPADFTELEDAIDEVAADVTQEASLRSSGDSILQNQIDILDGRVDDLEAAGGAAVPVAWRTTSLSTTNDVRYMLPYTGSSSGDTNEDRGLLIWPKAGTFSHLYVHYVTASGDVDQVVYSMRINKATPANTLTVTKPNSAGTTSDTTHTVTVAAGDRVSMQLDQTAGSPGTVNDILVSWLFTPS